MKKGLIGLMAVLIIGAITMISLSPHSFVEASSQQESGGFKGGFGGGGFSGGGVGGSW